VRLYRSDGTPIGTPLVHVPAQSNQGVWFVAQAPDGNRIVSSAIDGTVMLWKRAVDGSYRKERLLHRFAEGVCAIAFDTRGERVACGSEGEGIRVYDVGGRLLEDYRVDSMIRCCRFFPDGTHLGATTADGRFLTWYLDQDELQRRAEALLPRRWD
jgi:WD40 repeat protein